MEKYDIAFVGGGPAGYTGAIKAAQLGKKVLLIEKDQIGGTCLNRGCIPTKSLISSVQLADHARRAEDFGIIIPRVDIDYSQVLARKEKVIEAGRKGIQNLFSKWGVTVLSGSCSLAGIGELEVVFQDSTRTQIKAENIILSTGARPAVIPGLEPDHIHIFTSDSICSLEALPKSLLIVGGGAIGCEYAYIFSRLGVDITICEMEPQLLPLEDTEIAKVVEREFKKRKIKVKTGKAVSQITKKDEHFHIEFAQGKTVTAEKILVSIGRVPNSDGIGLESVGLQTGIKGGVSVNEKLETGVQGLYAAGDITGKYLLAYVAEHEAITIVDNIAGKEKVMHYNAVPAVLFSEPEVGSVGLTERQAKAECKEIKVGRFQFRALGRSQASGETAGMAKVVCDGVSGKILGVHIAGAHASEIIHMGVVALQNGMTATDLGDTLFAHPVFSEALLEAAWDVSGSSVHKI